MGFWTLFEVATMPVLQVLIISCLGAFLATGYCNVLHADARKYMNKVVFIVFTPSLMFASLVKTVTFQEIISWWFMPVNIGLTFLFGGILGWIVVKLLKPERHLEGLVIATCSAGNLGNLLLIVIPAICNEKGSPFGEPSICGVHGIAYASFSMALGGFYIWTYTYHLIRTSGQLLHQRPSVEEAQKVPNKEIDSEADALLLKNEDSGLIIHIDEKNPNKKGDGWFKLKGILHQVVDELLAPPTIAAIWGFIFGAVPWLKSLLIGSNAPLRVLQDSIKLLGDGTIPCITLILGGNLTQGLRSGRLRPVVIFAIIAVRYMILPAIGIAVVRTASQLGFLSADPLYQYVLMVQFTLPPAMNIGTMTQLFDVGQDECSVVFLWTYLVAALALTVWSTFYMWILT
ncbi:protein PIN-LIKES 7-like [Aristolochia californica]|uniref:protein PIN-LIKES 7-like n=1 Tax=Aristolochia californica TaxID=171875 RepID=UPI0035E1361A